MAWLQAVPKPPEFSRRAKAQSASKVSRADRLKADGITPPMPPNPAPHIIARLIEIGLTGSNGMGPVPLSWSELGAWQQLTGVELPPWEARLLRRLSLAYIAESRRAELEACPPPWRAPVTAREREIEEQKLRMVLG